MRFRQFLEDSYGEKDIPKFFYLVAKSYALQELAKTGSIKGIKGISASVEVVSSFFYGHAILFIMPGRPTVELNSLSRVMYNNPHYLTSKNLAPYVRIQQVRMPQSHNIQAGINDIFYDLVQRLSKVSAEIDVMQGHPIAEVLIKTIKDFKNKISGSDVKFPEMNIRNANDFANRIIGLLRFHYGNLFKVLSPKIVDYLKKMFIELLPNIVEPLSVEEEWLVKNQSLKVPAGSTILVGGWLERKEYLTDEDYETLSKKYHLEFGGTMSTAAMRAKAFEIISKLNYGN